MQPIILSQTATVPSRNIHMFLHVHMCLFLGMITYVPISRNDYSVCGARQHQILTLELVTVTVLALRA